MATVNEIAAWRGFKKIKKAFFGRRGIRTILNNSKLVGICVFLPMIKINVIYFKNCHVTNKLQTWLVSPFGLNLVWYYHFKQIFIFLCV